MHKLPHPIRTNRFLEATRFYDATPGDGVAALLHQVAGLTQDLSRPLRHIVAEQFERDPRFRELCLAMEAVPGSVNAGSVITILHAVQLRLTQAPILTIGDDLLTRLEATEIDKGLPVKYLRPPYPLCYVEFGERRDWHYAISNCASGRHVLEGAYVHLIEGHPLFGTALDITFTGSPHPDSHALDDTSTEAVLDLSDPERPIEAAFESAMAKIRARIGGPTLIEQYGWQDELLAAMRPLAKALLYLNCAGVRAEHQRPRAELLQRLEGIKSAHKRRKLERQAERTYDRIYVRAPAETTTGLARAGGVKAHWRRGHFRNQACGAGLREHRLIWIEPTLVGMGDARPRHYVAN